MPGVGKPQRVRVTNPRMGTSSSSPTRPAVRDLTEQTGVGAIYLRSLLRAQMRAALAVIGAFVIVLGAVPLLLAGRPDLTDIRLLGLPLSWWVIGVSLYPAMVTAAWWLDRSANRAERDFTEIVDRT